MFVPRIIFILQVKIDQGHIILVFGSKINLHPFGKIVIAAGQGELSPSHVAEGDDALHLLEVHIAIAIGVFVRARVVERKGVVKPKVVAPFTVLFVRCPAPTGIHGSRCTYQCKEKRQDFFYYFVVIMIFCLTIILTTIRKRKNIVFFEIRKEFAQKA